MATVADTLRAAAARLPGDEARREAELLLLHVLRRERAWLFAHGGDELDGAAVAAFDVLVDRRAAGEPVAQLTGRRGFWTLDLQVDATTLIPRPETEVLVEQALDRLPQDRDTTALDLGTGTGAIALALARASPRARGTAVDASAGALAVAARNVESNGVRVELLHGDWFAPVAGRRFDVIASNPPYIADDDPHLSRGDLRFEPRSALASGADGLDDLRRIVAAAPAHLHAGGWLLVEHGHDQGAAVRALFDAAGFDDVATTRDLEGRDRVTSGRCAG